MNQSHLRHPRSLKKTKSYLRCVSIANNLDITVENVLLAPLVLPLPLLLLLLLPHEHLLLLPATTAKNLDIARVSVRNLARVLYSKEKQIATLPPLLLRLLLLRLCLFVRACVQCMAWCLLGNLEARKILANGITVVRKLARSSLLAGVICLVHMQQ